METTETNALGSVHISQRAISVLASQTAAAVSGVASLGASIAETAARKIGRTSLAQGVDAVIDGREVELTVRLVVQYGYRIPDIALAVQKKVKDAVESSAGCSVTAVHVRISRFPTARETGRKGAAVMTEHSDSFAYTISESALAKIAATAALGTKGVAGKKGRGIVVKYLDGIVAADVHIQAY